MLHLLLSALQQTLIFLPLAFGVYLSYQILAVTDLTIEGSFVLGAAIFARFLTLGFNQIFSLILALIGGLLAGIFVCLMQKIAKINSLIAGIIAVFMLYSVNFGIMGRPNIGLLDQNIFLQYLQNSHPLGLWLFLCAYVFIVALIMILLLHSKTGLSLRAYGTNPVLLKRLGRKPTLYLALGLGLSNSIGALCGVITAESNGYADINMGQGMALTAIGAVVIGTKLMQSFTNKTNQFSAFLGLFACFIGGYIYFLALNCFLAIGLDPIYLKFFLGLLLIVFLSSAYYTRQKNYEYEPFAQIR